MVAFPPCKINLGLSVLRKRPDGFHDIETCFVHIPWTDILEIIPATEFSFTTSGLSIPGDLDDNLCVKAWKMLKADYAAVGNVSMHLHKILPTGAGLGGGSSDGAWALRLINDIFQLSLPVAKLSEYASKLGSDCSFFLYDTPMIGVGRGNELTPVDLSLKGFTIVIVKPEVHVSTAQAYAGVKPQVPFRTLREQITTTAVGDWKDRLKNDFEESVFDKFPSIARIKHQLYSLGAIYASMSGSGSAVFGIFPEVIDVKNSFEESDIVKVVTL